MALTGPSSYVPTINEFLAHWLQVNTALGGGGPLVLSDGTTLAILTGYRDSLMTFGASIQGKLNDVEIARGNIEIKRVVVINRLGEFNRKVRGFLSHTAFVTALPEVPPGSSSVATLVDALDDMATLWVKINAATIPGFTGPLTLLGGYLVATFNTDLAALKTDSTTWQNAVQDVKLERERRNDLQDKVQPALRDYRAAVLGSFAETDALVETLPRLTPEAGSTPDGVVVNGIWDMPQLKAKLTWSASTDPNLSQYEIRFCAGPNYSTENESVIGSVTPAETREFLTDSGLTTAGNTASFKVYVVLTTGNEKGSNTVAITRP